MKNSTSLRRHYLVIEICRRRKNATFLQIQEYLQEHDLEISTRTLQRDFEDIRRDYQINIEYSPYQKGYFINEDTTLPIDDFLHFLEMVSFSELMLKSLTDAKEAFRYIQFENTESLKGVYQLKDILFAIQNKRILNFKHENFWKNTVTAIAIKPLLIKEYQRRWYVIGALANDDIRTFGIDRISELQVMEKVFKVKKEWNAAENFNSIIGISYEGERSEVILSFDAFQGKYIKTLPLHHTQKILMDNEQEFRISIDVIVNFELKQRILMYGPNVEVIEPKSLKQEIKEMLTETLKFYKKI